MVLCFFVFCFLFFFSFCGKAIRQEFRSQVRASSQYRCCNTHDFVSSSAEDRSLCFVFSKLLFGFLYFIHGYMMIIATVLIQACRWIAKLYSFTDMLQSVLWPVSTLQFWGRPRSSPSHSLKHILHNISAFTLSYCADVALLQKN